MANINIEIVLKTATCHRGHIYAVPWWAHEWKYKCPMCASDEIKELLERVDNLWIEGRHLNRVIIGLRGAITRMKKL